MQANVHLGRLSDRSVLRTERNGEEAGWMDGRIHVRTCVEESAVEIKDHGGDLVRGGHGRRSTLGGGGPIEGGESEARSRWAGWGGSGEAARGI